MDAEHYRYLVGTRETGNLLIFDFPYKICFKK